MTNRSIGLWCSRPPYGARHRAALVVILVTLAATGCAPEPVSPNIVMFDLDTLRADHLGAYGYPAPTSPRLDALASRGILMRYNYAQAGWTPPSQTSLMTSVYPTVHKVRSQGQMLDPSIPMLAEILRENGYATAGHSQLMGDSFARGFDEYVWRKGEWMDGPIDPDMPAAMQSMRDWATEQTKPFFLFFHSFQVHVPYAPLPEYAARFIGDYDGPLLDRILNRDLLAEINSGQLEVTPEDVAYLIAMCNAELAYVDEQIGQFLDWLDSSGLGENTIVVLVSDHGDEFGEHGALGRHGTLYNEVIRTPVIMAGPGIPEGRVFDQMSRNIDVAPTLLSLAGVPVPESFQGASLRPIWDGTETEGREVFSELAKAQVLIRGRYKFVLKGRHLFDLQEDPTEQNAVRRGAHRDKIREMETRIEALMMELNERAEYTEGSVFLSDEEMRQLRALGYVR